MLNTIDAPHLEQLTGYISNVFKPCTTLKEDWAGVKHLPLYLQANWAYKQLSLDGQTCLLMWDYQGEQQEAAQKLKKAIAAVAEQFSGPVIYGVSDTAFYNRKRLIDQGIAFVVPGKQLYLPFAALDLRESFAINRKVNNTLGACAQQLVLLKCAGRWRTNLSAQARADQLGVSKMTVSRAYKELTDLGLAHIEGSTRLGKLEFEAGGYALWQMVLGYLTNPVKQQVSIGTSDCDKYQDLFRYEAGEWALAQQGMLTTPKQRCVAVAWADWAGIKKLTGIRELVNKETESVQVQLWRYEPGFMPGGGFNLQYYNSPAVVDPLSLYLNLRAEPDERIQMALEDLLNQFWNSYSEREQ